MERGNSLHWGFKMPCPPLPASHGEGGLCREVVGAPLLRGCEAVHGEGKQAEGSLAGPGDGGWWMGGGSSDSLGVMTGDGKWSRRSRFGPTTEPEGTGGARAGPPVDVRLRDEGVGLGPRDDRVCGRKGGLARGANGVGTANSPGIKKYYILNGNFLFEICNARKS